MMHSTQQQCTGSMDSTNNETEWDALSCIQYDDVPCDIHDTARPCHPDVKIDVLRDSHYRSHPCIHKLCWIPQSHRDWEIKEEYTFPVRNFESRMNTFKNGPHI
ncbi:hypothetical protein CHS0354_032913 [Potamilus streckersoni]|uniref:Uncharacterized protein n=1 Tax=Potamilus streckersoni TaxID=2493646 RepID=A0AAE0RWB6_9BIVA|nr:hypothetical protein CHS0354_032913 [Potamilus streckersoni]